MSTRSDPEVVVLIVAGGDHWLISLEGQQTSLLIRRFLREPEKSDHLKESGVSMKNGLVLMVRDIHLGYELW